MSRSRNSLRYFLNCNNQWKRGNHALHDPYLLLLNTYELVYTLKSFQDFCLNQPVNHSRPEQKPMLLLLEPPNSLTASMQILKWASSEQKTGQKIEKNFGGFHPYLPTIAVPTNSVPRILHVVIHISKSPLFFF